MMLSLVHRLPPRLISLLEKFMYEKMTLTLTSFDTNSGMRMPVTLTLKIPLSLSETQKKSLLASLQTEGACFSIKQMSALNDSVNLETANDCSGSGPWNWHK
jgi:hypothetical protein